RFRGSTAGSAARSRTKKLSIGLARSCADEGKSGEPDRANTRNKRPDRGLSNRWSGTSRLQTAGGLEAPGNQKESSFAIRDEGLGDGKPSRRSTVGGAVLSPNTRPPLWAATASDNSRELPAREGGGRQGKAREGGVTVE